MLNGVEKEKVPSILSVIDISVLPGSTDIICPIKIMEYMAAETAVIAPDYNCNREIIIDKINGVLFKPADLKNLIDQILFLLTDDKKRIEIAKQGQDYVRDNLIWEQTWGSVLKNILNHGLVSKKQH
jgi:glycosyltransferase involved in cell wall biosynthesis